jgi:hypothetical protein
MRKAIIGTVAALGLSGPVLAEDGLSYSFVELGYINTETDFDEGDGLSLSGSYAVAELAHIFTSYSDQDFDNSNVRTEFMQIGLGLNFTIAENIDLVPRLSYVDVQVEVPPFGTFDDNGYAAGVALRAKLFERFELSGGFNYQDLDDSGEDTLIFGTARFYITDKIALAADIQENDGDMTYILGGRYDFRGY